MNLSDALDGPSGNNQSNVGGVWPGQQPQPSWPGQPPNPTAPSWQGGNSGGGMWPGSGPTPFPSKPQWPGTGPAPSPSGPGWPGSGPTPGPAHNPSKPGWPGSGPAPFPSEPQWPGTGPAPSPSRPGWPSTGPASGPGPSPSGPGWPGSGPAPGPAHSPSGPGWPSPAPKQNLSIPYTQNLPSGVDKVSITIAGTIKPKPDKITVDLSTGRDLAFHFNPRFNESGRQVIVRNSCIGGQWGAEERELRHFPFFPGQPFELKIDCTNREFKVAVNNAHLLTYQHRITDLRSINTLSIYNDLSLSNVDVKFH